MNTLCSSPMEEYILTISRAFRAACLA